MPGEQLNRYSFTWKSLNEDERCEINKYWSGPATVMGGSVILSQPGNVVLPKKFASIAEKVYNMEVRPDDIWIVTYPKCGTTWTQEMVWQIVHDVDFVEGKKPLSQRVPFVESQMLINEKLSEAQIAAAFPPIQSRSVDYASSLPSPRCLKTHLPLNMLPERLLDTCKVIYVARDPRDVCVSFYYHEQIRPELDFRGTFEEFFEFFQKGGVLYGDYFYHLEQALKRASHPNLKLLRFEDMKRDLQGSLRDTADFLGRDLTNKQISQLEAHLSFDNFKKNPAVNKAETVDKKKGLAFIRKGIVGDWKNHFTWPQAVEKLDSWVDRKMIEHSIRDNLEIEAIC